MSLTLSPEMTCPLIFGLSLMYGLVLIMVSGTIFISPASHIVIDIMATGKHNGIHVNMVCAKTYMMYVYTFNLFAIFIVSGILKTAKNGHLRQ